MRSEDAPRVPYDLAVTLAGGEDLLNKNRGKTRVANWRREKSVPASVVFWILYHRIQAGVVPAPTSDEALEATLDRVRKLAERTCKVGRQWELLVNVLDQFNAH